MSSHRTFNARYAFLILSLLSGCGTGTNGVVPIGDGAYMIGGLGRFTDYSGSAVKARYFEDASKYCSERGQTMLPLNSTAKDSGLATYASAEVQFRCVDPIAKPTQGR